MIIYTKTEYWENWDVAGLGISSTPGFASQTVVRQARSGGLFIFHLCETISKNSEDSLRTEREFAEERHKLYQTNNIFDYIII